MELSNQSCFMLHTILSSISDELAQVDTHGVGLGLYLATGKHLKSGLVGYHADDDDGLELWMLLIEANLKRGLVHAFSSSSRVNPG
ncbi:hypothetical protein Tco_1391568 [Tanacetum coccineum]